MPDADDKERLDALHTELFGDLPVAEGGRFERLVAIVMAAIGEPFVRHDVRAARSGRRAIHQIDVWVEREGREQLVIVECKHWASRIGKDVVDRIVGVQRQLQAAEAVVVGVEGFTKGAIAVAADEHIRLVRMRPIRDQSNWHGVLREIRMRGRLAVATPLEWMVRAVDPSELPPGGLVLESPNPEPRLELADGTPAELIVDLMNLQPSASEPGEYDQTLELPEGRYMRIDDQRRIAVRALEWRERIDVAHIERVFGPRSPGLILVEELDTSGDDELRRRVLMDHQLRRWTIGKNRVVGPADEDEA